MSSSPRDCSTTTVLPVTQIAFTAGFGSVRRFNTAVRNVYGRSPRDLRRERHGSRGDSSGIVLRLGYRPPFHWNQIIDFLSPRAVRGVERVDADEYARAVTIGEFCGVARVRPGSRNALELRVPAAAGAVLADLVPRFRELFDLDCDPAAIDRVLGEDGRPSVGGRRVSRSSGSGLLGPLRARGPRCAGPAGHGARCDYLGFPSGRAIRRAHRLGGGGNRSTLPATRPPFPEPGSRRSEFPARASTGRCVRSRGRSRAGIFALMRRGAWRTPCIDCAHFPGSARGTAQYIAMRALREPDAFPAGDLVVRKALADEAGLPAAPRADEISQAWRPWRSYAVFHL